MLEFSRAAANALLLAAFAANCSAQITQTNLGLKNWFGRQSWVSDIAGVQGAPGFNNNNILATSALLNPDPTGFNLSDVKTDRAGNVYLSDSYNNQIRMIEAGTGIIRVVAGSGNTACTDEMTVAPLSGNLARPTGLALDAQGNIYVSEFSNSRIRMISADRQTMTTIAGTCAPGGYNGSPSGVNAATAQLYGPNGIAVDPRGNVLVADTFNQMVRMIAGGPFGATMYDIAGAAGVQGIVATSFRQRCPP